MVRIIAVVLGLALTLGLAGCKKEDGPVKPSYTPVADADLFKQVEEISGVADVDVKFRKSFTNGTGYYGPITVEEGVNAADVLDHAYAILRQGRFNVVITVYAVQGNREIFSDAFGLTVGTAPNLRERYGPQPGDGEPPSPGTDG
jgi:hypothetical protein